MHLPYVWSLNIFFDLLNVFFLLFIAQGKIPPNATLIFEIELYAVNKGPRSVEAFNQIDKDSDRKLSELEVMWHNEFGIDYTIMDILYQH